MAELQLKYDGPIVLATGRSRKSLTWKNEEWQWSDFLEKISETHRTAEKYIEYMHEKKAFQDERKDVGGYVGGYLVNGKRKNGNVLSRRLVTLDIDFGNADIWENYKLMYGNAAAVYSTHKHSPASPRLRLIIPLDRDVTVDEYVAIGRRIAGTLGINYFDDTTFQATRLMYWPSTSIDAEYFFDYVDDYWMSADAILGSYRNWQDASEWPFSDRVNEVVHREMKKQEDPTEKPGIVGAFCRVYGIAEAIEKFLYDKYEACDVEDRYTYTQGSTAAGLVVYDNKFAYSHHGTDPCSGKLCNAFDLVRIHLFNLKDEDVKPGTPGNKTPSYAAMTELATKDPDTRLQLGTEKLEAAASEFGIVLDPDYHFMPSVYSDGTRQDEDDEEMEEGFAYPDVPGDSAKPELDTEWMKKLDVDKNGIAKSTIDNVVLILENDPYLRGKLAMNIFTHREVLRGSVPWRKIRMVENMVDSDDAGLRHYLEYTYDISSAPKIKDGLDIVVKRNAFNPVLEYLEGVRWDGVKRVDTLLIDFLNCPDEKYVREVTRKTLVAGVRRIYEPGCKFDNVLVLVGTQGCGKSTLVKKLGKQWFSDSFSTVQGKEAFEQLQGKWILELAELSGLKKAEVNAVKHFTSKQEDAFRVAYGKRTENFPRQNIFIGTTNDPDFLQDPTGNRRFWPVDTGEKYSAAKSVFDDLTDKVVDQIWAEAVYLYKGGENLYLDREVEEVADKHQREHAEVDERTGIVVEYLEMKLPENWKDLELYVRRNFVLDENQRGTGTIKRSRVSVVEIWCEALGNKISDLSRFNSNGINNILRSLPDWEYSKNPVDVKPYGRQRVYHRKLSFNVEQKQRFDLNEKLPNFLE